MHHMVAVKPGIIYQSSYKEHVPYPALAAQIREVSTGYFNVISYDHYVVLKYISMKSIDYFW